MPQFPTQTAGKSDSRLSSKEGTTSKQRLTPWVLKTKAYGNSLCNARELP
jgi:hypothetical protein